MAMATRCHLVTRGTDKSAKTFSHEVSTQSGNSGAIPEEDPVRKAKLLSTVAFALLLGAGAASAQGMSKDTPERAPAAQQNAPAEKVAPSMKNGEHQAAPTGGQATPDAKSGKAAQGTPDTKSGKARETTGQAPRSGTEDKTQSKSMDQNKTMDKDSMDKDSRPSSREQNAQGQSGTSSKSTTQSTTEQNRATTGQGSAAGGAKLSTEQRTKISSVIRSQKVERVNNLNVSVSVGTRIPASVHVHPLPQEVFVIYPEWRGYDYILVGEEIVIINPRTHEIVAVLEA